MMIEFAVEAERTEGKSPRDAIYEACLLRFRAIIDDDNGGAVGRLAAGDRGRHGFGDETAPGNCDGRGLIVSQMMTLFTTPVIYLYLDRFRLRFKRSHMSTREKRIGSELVDSES